MDMKRNPLVLLTDEKPVENEAEILKDMLGRSGFRLHLRHPGTAESILEKILEKIGGKYMGRISLHDYPEQALRWGTGFHANKRCPLEEVRKFGLGPLSASLHTADDLRKVRDLDYASFGPVFASFSKPGYGPQVERAELDALLNLPQTCALYALGGVDATSLTEVKKLGFAGAAVLGAVWQSADPRSTLDELLEKASDVFAAGAL